ncbi:SidA/IucD/PvdA family monooxygenase [Paracidovorax avenae]|uniref:SidA/IucD/PvdA family monooxygenase n=1 Tax=Paracidovorax avenae TaxID=80867 RepID=UPI000D224535|nr:NAD(P)/FAD-dependent oxidoreductase [Paracidovorax avenae]AVT04126.1 FAD-dependent oxidoreductase [Paracidovorax avenae]
MALSSSLGAAGLAALEQRLQHDLLTLNWRAKAWLPQRTHAGRQVIDVLIIGAGQAGLAASMALAQQGIPAVLLDRAPEDHEGPWATTARMETLRSPKELTGPALGVPSLTFRAWFEAQWGGDAWAALDKIPRLQWMDYLRWYRRVTRADVRNGHAVTAVQPRGDGLVEVDVQAQGHATTWFARRVVLATGRDGLGGPQIPAFMQGVGRSRWAHSSDVLDYATLRGLRVGVVGAGSSAMDSAATALECGAASVDLLVRRPDLPRINKSKGSGVPGLTHGHHDLPDAWKWRIRHYINTTQVPPPHGSTLRVSRHPNAFFHLGCPVQGVRENPADGALHVATLHGTFAFDFLIVSTGFAIDWAQKPEFAAIAPHVRTWGARYTPPPGDEDQELADSPDLGPGFEFREKLPGDCPGLERVHCFCYPAALSHGTVSGDIPAISDGARRLATGLASLFYREDVDYHFGVLQAYAEPELLGDEWSPADTARRVLPG